MQNVTIISDKIAITALVSPESGQGWKCEFFEIAEPIPAHYHKIQRQIMVVAEGELIVFCDGEKRETVHGGELICVDPGIVHSLVPQETARFFCIDIPGFSFPEDVFYDQPVATSHWVCPRGSELPEINTEQFNRKIDLGTYAAYDLIAGGETENRWSVALLEISDSPKHFHKRGKEIFVVVNGTLRIEVDGIEQMLNTGEHIIISPNSVHHLQSATNDPVRVLCFNFPAFDPADMYCVE